MKLLLSLLLTLTVTSNVTAEESTLDIPLKDIDGKSTSLKAHKGKVMLVVNVASQCGLTRQYKQLQAVHSKYAKKGFTVLGFPCNQFGRQEPGSAGEISDFCSKNYGVTFQMMSKVDVKGDNQDPVYSWLCNAAENGVGDHKVGWNFHKFLVDAEGNLVASLKSGEDPMGERIVNFATGK